MAGQGGLRVELLGGFQVVADGRAVARLPTARQQELIAFLILNARGTATPRQRIAGALWPESTGAPALQSPPRAASCAASLRW